MKEDKFIQQNANTWSLLEGLLKKLNSKGFKRFGKKELDELLSLYNLASGHLSYSRTNYGNSDTTIYLNRLVSGAHSIIYSVKVSRLKEIRNFLFLDFPRLLFQNRLPLILSTSIFIFGCIFSFIISVINPENASAFVPKEILDSLNLSGKAENILDSSVMSSYIFTNNIKVGFMAFALGVTLGIGTVWVSLTNSFMLGSLGAIAFDRGANLNFWSLILPHGILELFAIFVCAAAGLIIGYSLINPGVYSRKDSFILKGVIAVKFVLGSIPIFIIAGLVEGFITPSGLPPEGKLVFALFTFVLLLFYLVAPNVIFKEKIKE